MVVKHRPKPSFLHGHIFEQPKNCLEVDLDHLVEVIDLLDKFLNRFEMDDFTWGAGCWDNLNGNYSLQFGDSISERLNEGYAYMEFIGHSCAFYNGDAFFMENYEDPSILHNESKYPFIVSISCETGWFDHFEGDGWFIDGVYYQYCGGD